MSLGGNDGGLLDPEVVDEGVRASVQSGPSIVFEVLKSGAVEHLKKLIHEKIPSAPSDLFYAPADRNNAEEFLEVYKGVVPEYHVLNLIERIED